MSKIVVIAHNLRSAHNVGSLLRTADGMGVDKVYFTGYTPYPLSEDDGRLPHIAAKIDKQINKTALGAQNFVDWQRQIDVAKLLSDLKREGFTVAALEQTPRSIKLSKFEPPAKVAVILGREVEGIEPEVLELADVALEIPMLGHKESLNVVQAAAIAFYHLRYAS